MKQREFLDKLWSNGIRKLYLAHYDDAGPARFLKTVLLEHGFTKVVIARDARQYGKEFVSQVIEDCDLVLVINPVPEHEHLIEVAGQGIIEVEM